ncbi:2-methylthioadenine synthetase, partial [Candidatus Scalindua japonica]
MKRLCLTVLAFFVLFLLATDLRAQDESQKMKEKLQKAMRELKNEIRLDVGVENPGIITGKVKCR